MNKYYTATIKWEDDGTEYDVIFSEYDSLPSDKDPVTDDDVFYYGISRETAFAEMTIQRECVDFEIIAVGDYI